MRLELRFALLAVFLALLQIASPTPGAAAPAAQALLDGQFASAIVIDADTGEVLLEKNAHARRQPASMPSVMMWLMRS